MDSEHLTEEQSRILRDQIAGMQRYFGRPGLGSPGPFRRVKSQMGTGAPAWGASETPPDDEGLTTPRGLSEDARS